MSKPNAASDHNNHPNHHQEIQALLDLTGQVAIVSGASKGIGAAIARRLAQAGAELVLFSRHIDVSATEEYYQTAYGRVPLVMQADMSDAESLRKVITATQARFDNITILVNNAAINATGGILTTNEADWINVLQNNVVGIAQLCQLVAPSMMTQQQGRIINIASNLGAFALPEKGLYSASKAALMQFTRNLALELAPYHILVNSLAVGAVDNEMVADSKDKTRSRKHNAIADSILLHRLGTPDEIANVVLFLASGMSTFITGQAIFVDGGASIWFRE